jgi:DNA-binding winged helix-turn-helix (wHTH) protein
MDTKIKISFGPYVLDEVNECLWRENEEITLRPKAYAVLRYLLSNPGVLVTKQQLLEAVWPETFVSDAVLKDSVRQLERRTRRPSERTKIHTNCSSPWLSFHRPAQQDIVAAGARSKGRLTIAITAFQYL